MSTSRLPQVTTPADLIEEMDASIRDLLLARISILVHEPPQDGATMAGFVLAACAIDTLAGFHAGLTNRRQRGVGKRFKSFVKDHMPSYDEQALYHDLRCGLVHSFSDANMKYLFGPGARPLPGSGLTQILLVDLYAHINAAYVKLRQDILIGSTAFEKARDRFNAIGLIRRLPRPSRS